MKITNQQLRQIIKEELEKVLGQEDTNLEDDLMAELFPEEISESLLAFGGTLGYAIAAFLAYFTLPAIDLPSRLSVHRGFEVSLNRFLNTVPDLVKERIGKEANELEEEEVAILLSAFEEDKELTSLTQQYMDLTSKLEKELYSLHSQEHSELYEQRRELGRKINDKLDALTQRRY